MMETSSRHQKQKLTLTEASPIARRTLSKRATVLGIGIVSAVTLPAIVYASTSHQSSTSRKANSTQSTSVNVHSTASPDSGEAFSIPNSNTETIVTETTQSDEPSDVASDVEVTVNGHSIPVTEGTTSQTIANSDGSSVEVNISVDNSSDTDISTSSSTRVRSNISTSTSYDSSDPRGSP